MKKLMILGAGQYVFPLIRKAKEKGHYVIVVSPGTYSGMELADKVIDCDIGDEEGVLFFAEQEGVDGITSDEMDLPLLAWAGACEQLHLPGNPYRVVRAFTDKQLTRERCEELGIRSLEHAGIRSVEEGKEFLKNHPGPAIIKPVDSGASKGIAVIRSEEDLEAHFPEAMSYSRRGEVIIERFLKGKEFEVDGIVLDGRYETLMIGDLTKFTGDNPFSCSSILFPSTEKEDLLEKLKDYDREVVLGLGLHQGLTHNEYILDEETGEFYLIEAAARGGGRHISTAIAKLQTGIDTSDFLIDAALGEIEELPPIRRGLCHCGYMAFCLPEGEILSLDGIREVEDLPFVFLTTLEELKPGMRTAQVKDKRQRHLIYLKGDSREELKKYMEQIRGMLTIRVKTDRGEIKGPVWG